MIRPLLPTLLLLLAALIGTAPAPGQEASLPDLVDRVRPGVVIVESFDATGKLAGTASGFFIGPDRFITTRHAVQAAAHVAVVFRDGARFPVARILAEDEVGDLVLLEVEDLQRDVTPLTVTRTIPRDGEDIFVIGGPLGMEQAVSRGILAGRLRMPFEIDMLQIDAAISRGSSGSPVMNMAGEVFGIAAAKIPEGENVNLAIPAERIYHLEPNPMPFEQWARFQIVRQQQTQVQQNMAKDGIRAAYPIAIPAAVRQAVDGVVKVRAFGADGEELDAANGFFVMATRVLTVRARLIGADRVTIETAAGEELAIVGVVADDPLGGLTMLEVAAPKAAATVLDLDWRRPYREEPLVAVPFGAVDDEDFPQHRVIWTSTDLPGFGPALAVGVINERTADGTPVVSAKGQALAAVSSRDIDGVPLRFVVPADRIRQHLFADVVSLGDWNRANADEVADRGRSAIWLALPFMLTQQWQPATRILERGVTEEMRDPDRWLAIAMCRNNLADWAAVIDAANHALALDANSSLACFLIGLGFTGQAGRAPVEALTRARDMLRRAIDLDPDYNYHSYIRLAAILADFGEVEQAINVMETAVEIWPDRPETHHMLASLYMHHSTMLTDDHEFGLGDKFRRMSLQEASRTVKLAPFASWAFTQLSRSAALNKTNEPAISAARTAVALAPTDPAALDNLARIYLLCGDKKSAVETCDLLREIDATAAQQLLEIIRQREPDRR